jgi:hypothetical protein
LYTRLFLLLVLVLVVAARTVQIQLQALVVVVVAQGPQQLEYIQLHKCQDQLILAALVVLLATQMVLMVRRAARQHLPLLPELL